MAAGSPPLFQRRLVTVPLPVGKPAAHQLLDHLETVVVAVVVFGMRHGISAEQLRTMTRR
ncbi:hypothetical protein [Mycobacterium avium]|uniref:hypothetical protein n=1 Tax=Mycobacterium avium TaxID=1764 RepID=UPI0013C47DAA|nr:hypothetical protein [Mycobacterium avium]